MLVHADAPLRKLPQVMALHRFLAVETGFAGVTAYRNQLLPSIVYRAPLTAIAAAAERALGKRLGQRFVLVAARPDTSRTN